MVIYNSGDVLSRQDCSLKTASRKGNIIRKILFQNTNANKIGRSAVAFMQRALNPAPLAYAA